MIEYLLRRPPLDPDVIGFILTVLVSIPSVILHEYAHARVATFLGDPTPRHSGRLTFAPKPHLNLLGAFMFLLAGFGWGEPVPVAPNRFKNGRLGEVMVALAGPAANLILAVAAAAAISLAGPTVEILDRFLGITFRLNVVLLVFNLVPLPPLDGYPLLLMSLSPAKRFKTMEFMEKWGLLLLLLTGFFLFEFLAGPLIRLLGRAILFLVGA